MYQIITTDFNGFKSVQVKTDSFIYIKSVYESLLKRCLYGFPDIQTIEIIKNDNETISEFVNWKR